MITALIGFLLAAAAALIVIELRRERTICASCGLSHCDGSCSVVEWPARETVAIAKLERGLAEQPMPETLEPWRELLETL